MAKNNHAHLMTLLSFVYQGGGWWFLYKEEPVFAGLMFSAALALSLYALKISFFTKKN